MTTWSNPVPPVDAGRLLLLVRLRCRERNPPLFLESVAVSGGSSSFSSRELLSESSFLFLLKRPPRLHFFLRSSRGRSGTLFLGGVGKGAPLWASAERFIARARGAALTV